MRVEDVVIRKLLPEDSITEMTELLHLAYGRLRDMGLRYMATHQGDDTTRERVQSGECYIGVRDGRIVATLTFRAPSETSGCPWYDRPDVASFGQFAVLPDLQGLGVGRALMDLAERRALEAGAVEIALDTAKGASHLIEIYERRGYRIVESADWPETNYVSLVMSKRVRPSS